MPHARSILVAATSAAAALAFAAPANAATVTTSECVPSAGLSSLKTMPITGTGFTPGAQVTIRYASRISPTPSYLTAVTAGPTGDIATLVSPPLFNKFDTQEQSFGISATDGSNPAIVAATTFKQVRIGYTTDPPRGRPSRIAKHTVRGFPPGKSTYLHFRFRGKTKRNVKLGKTSSPCGIVSRRLPLLPARSRTGKWTVYVDQTKKYTKNAPLQLKYTLLITQTFR